MLFRPPTKIAFLVNLAVAAAMPAALNSPPGDSLFSVAWKEAVNLVETGSLQRGITLLDSLRRVNDRIDDSLLAHYSRLATRCFLPVEEGRRIDSELVITGLPPGMVNVTLDDSEVVPDNASWNVTSPPGGDRGLPAFSYAWRFQLTEQVRLRFSLMSPATASLFSHDSSSRFAGEIPGPLIYNPEKQPWKMNLKIMVDCSSTQLPLRDYLCNIVCNNHDIIEERTEHGMKDAVSLRCYDRSVFRNIPDDFYAYVVFDRLVAAKKPAAAKKREGRTEGPVRVRYVIALSTSRAVEEKAEMILRNVLDKFRL